jgi:hypothetical protein
VALFLVYDHWEIDITRSPKDPKSLPIKYFDGFAVSVSSLYSVLFVADPSSFTQCWNPYS